MNILKLFYRHECPRCPVAMQVAEQLKEEGITVEYYDCDTADGLGESAFNSVMATPTLVLVDELDRELAAWRGSVPQVKEVLRTVYAAL